MNVLIYFVREDVVILCASGTAAVGDLHHMLDLDSAGALFGPPFLNNALNPGQINRQQQQQHLEEEEAVVKDCSMVHIPYAEYSLPYKCKTTKCRVCQKVRLQLTAQYFCQIISRTAITGKSFRCPVLYDRAPRASRHNRKRMLTASKSTEAQKRSEGNEICSFTYILLIIVASFDAIITG